MNLPLIYKHGEGKHFYIIKYPDGQQNIKLDMGYFNDPKQLIDIKCSVRNFAELEVLISLCAVLRKYDFTVATIAFNYLLGMRSDRSFEPGMPNYFRDVVAPIINSLPGNHFLVSPHSKLSLMALDMAMDGIISSGYEKSCFMIGADESSLQFYPEHFGHIPHFVKRRNGNELVVFLSKEAHEIIQEQPDHVPLLIMDDLCDGGATFIAIAEYLKIYFPNKLRYLYVVHGLFTKGVDHVAQHYHKVITTNSYQEFDKIEKLEVMDIWTL